VFEGIEIEEQALLAPYTTLHIGGPAEFLAFPKNQDELLRLVQEAKANSMPIYLLGGGSNLLISDDGVKGLVIYLTGDFSKIEISPSGDRISVGTAYPFPKLTRLCLELGWEIALGWSGVPGFVGGALKMNAGTRLGEIGEVVTGVEAVTPAGKVNLSHDQMGFSYRNTTFPEDAILCRAELVYPQARSERKAELLAKASELAKMRKATQPKQRSAGSMFKNPPGDFAGRLIEACGLKGTQIGGACISEVHANFIVNAAGASAKELLQLSELAQRKVYDQFGIELEFEVRRWGF
jgi:UDP-N-acetylmuramate dehydrogenase